MARTLVVVGAVLLLLGGCSSSNSTTSDECASLEQELAQVEVLLAEAADERDAAVALSEAIVEVEANETANIEAFMAKDLDALMDTTTEDVLWVDETYGDYMEGKATVRAMMSHVIKFTDPDATEVLELFVSEDGTRAVSTVDWFGTNAFGEPFHLPYVLISEYRDGKIAKQSIYYASPDAYGQLMGQ